MIPALAPLFTGELASIGNMLVIGEDSRETIPGTDLLDTEVLGTLLARFSRNYDAPEKRAVASQWSKWHFSVLLTPVLISSLVINHQVPTDLTDMDVILSPDGRTTALRLRHEGATFSPSNAFDRFSTVLTGHLEPVIANLASTSGITARVLWSNAGNIIEQVLKRVETAVGPDHPAIGETYELLNSRKSTDGKPNRLFQPIRYVKDGEKFRRQRRVCCIRYLNPSLDYCKTCPLTVREPK